MRTARLAAALAVLLTVSTGHVATAQTVGRFKFIGHVDPITHEDGSWIAVESDDRAGTLVWKCEAGTLNLFYMFGRRVEGPAKIAVETRFSLEPGQASVSWDVAEGRRGASLPESRVDAFTRQALRSPKVLFRFVGGDGKPATSQFPLDGLAGALSKLSCAKAYARPAAKAADEAADEEAEVAVEEPPNPRVIDVEADPAGSDWGMRLGNASPCNAPLMSGRSGVAVVEMLSFSGRAFRAGLKRGDVILEINGQGVASSAQAEKLLRGAAGAGLRLLVCRNEG